ncbi:hypothetical protein V6N13_145737 [Hibiscus sabdariffa]|uniref:Secreted protein n=1 Tax=Hibiscus sabdariffa TaxID=183260 RepID=A0ABR2TQR8_9ROSI
MKQYLCLVLVVSAMLVPSASVASCRTLQSTKKTGDATGEAVPEVNNVSIGSTSNSAEHDSGRVLSRQQVVTTDSGPSRKGPGH